MWCRRGKKCVAFFPIWFLCSASFGIHQLIEPFVSFFGNQISDFGWALIVLNFCVGLNVTRLCWRRILLNFNGFVIYGRFLVGSGCVGPPAFHSAQPYQVWWNRFKRLKSSGTGSKWVHHFNPRYRQLKISLGSMFMDTLILFWWKFYDFKKFRWPRIWKILSWPDGGSAKDELLAEVSL